MSPGMPVALLLCIATSGTAYHPFVSSTLLSFSLHDAARSLSTVSTPLDSPAAVSFLSALISLPYLFALPLLCGRESKVTAWVNIIYGEGIEFLSAQRSLGLTSRNMTWCGMALHGMAWHNIT